MLDIEHAVYGLRMRSCRSDLYIVNRSVLLIGPRKMGFAMIHSPRKMGCSRCTVSRKAFLLQISTNQKLISKYSIN